MRVNFYEPHNDIIQKISIGRLILQLLYIGFRFCWTFPEESVHDKR